MATINDVARECGVSPTTVSFVLNNGPRSVSARTRQRVLETIERLNYQPSGVARGLARQRMHTIGVLFTGHEPRIVHNPYAVALLDGVVAAATTLGYDVTLITRHMKAAEKAEAPGSAIFDGRVDGILLLSPLAGADATLGRSVRNTPLVQIGAPAVLPETLWMDVDNEQGARLAARHLLMLGHRRFGILLGPKEYEFVEERCRFFLAELAGAGLPPLAPHHRIADQDDLRGILLRYDRPTAILAVSDRYALHAIQVAQSLGLSVPESLSVIGFDDAPGSGAELSGLTTVRQPLFDMGHEAASRLIGRIERAAGATEETRDSAAPLLFAPELIVRRTTAPPPRLSPG